MTTYLSAKRGEFVLPDKGWPKLCALAGMFNPSRRADVGRKRFTAKQAGALAAEVRAMLPDVPRNDAMGEKVSALFDGRISLAVATKPTVLEFWAGPRRKRLERFVRFAKAGGFVVRTLR